MYDSSLFRIIENPDLHSRELRPSRVVPLANRYTFSLIFKRDMESFAAVRERRDNVVEMIVRYVRK